MYLHLKPPGLARKRSGLDGRPSYATPRLQLDFGARPRFVSRRFACECRPGYRGLRRLRADLNVARMLLPPRMGTDACPGCRSKKLIVKRNKRVYNEGIIGYRMYVCSLTVIRQSNSDNCQSRFKIDNTLQF
ncbi:hypothetical protein QE152_g41400 [Popillia japonica]|uniref:Uncharacterized protein n=1 Tax=Popillia japonica TaxID=7064 RepID=A0AAW1GQC3_POPJA